jgi:hypothetical protein
LLAISDHAIWSDPDLRRNLEWGTKGESSDKGCASSSCTRYEWFLIDFSHKLSLSVISSDILLHYQAYI